MNQLRKICVHLLQCEVCAATFFCTLLQGQKQQKRPKQNRKDNCSHSDLFVSSLEFCYQPYQEPFGTSVLWKLTMCHITLPSSEITAVSKWWQYRNMKVFLDTISKFPSLLSTKRLATKCARRFYVSESNWGSHGCHVVCRSRAQ